MSHHVIKKIWLILVIVSLFGGFTANAETVSVDASKLISRVQLSLSPASGSFVEGSTFDVPVLIDTKGSSINGVDIKINFDQTKLAIVQPSSGVSVIGVWIDLPRYDNTKGTLSYSGVAPGGIKSSSALIATITFKAISTGSASVSFRSDSNVLLNDGLGSKASVGFGSARYTIIPKAPGGVDVFSETHPLQDHWYNNNSPVLSWSRESGVSGFSYVLDNSPSTIPSNETISTDTTKAFDSLADGLWYFHIKANKAGAWGTTSHYLLRIDTTPPAVFKPEANYLVAATIFVQRTLISFSTTDSHSGVDHYEVGVIDKSESASVSPVFVQAESPFQVPLTKSSNLQAIIRAVDRAGNVRDVSIDIKMPFFVVKFVRDYIVYILIAIMLAGLVGLAVHYIFGRHIIRYARRALSIIKKEELQDKIKEQQIDQNLPKT